MDQEQGSFTELSAQTPDKMQDENAYTDNAVSNQPVAVPPESLVIRKWYRPDANAQRHAIAYLIQGGNHGSGSAGKGQL